MAGSGDAVTGPGGASEQTRALHASALEELPFEDREDLQDATRGLLASEPSLVLEDARGRVVWDMSAYDFVGSDRAAPDTVHPSLWRLTQLNRVHGLFEVVPGIYQVRGYDISNITFVEGRRGVVVVDPLISMECAAAALELYRRHRGERPVTAVLYTHSHVDHFGGVKGVVAEEEVRAGEVPVWAPAGFLEHAVSENVLAGTAMARRAEYMFGSRLARGPRGQVDAGIGKTSSRGTVTLIPPTHEVSATGQVEEIDGVCFVFQLVPESEAPAEMNFQLPGLRVLCVAENATHCMHNVLTPRGALVRDALRWSKYLGEAVELFGADSEVMFAQHHWPRWGRERIAEFLSHHRDLYRYLHDQTLRLANRGYTPTEIAAEVTLPPSLAKIWSCRGYYGTVSHNVRAVYQRYLGFFDGNPTHLDPLPPREAGRRYVDLREGWPSFWPWSGERLRTATIAGRPSSRRTPSSPTRSVATRESCRHGRWSSLAIRRRAQCGGICIWSVPTSCARARPRGQLDRGRRALMLRGLSRSSSCGTRSGCASTGPAPGTGGL